jgi:hypothetical protein
VKKGNDSKNTASKNDSGLNFEAQHWAAAEQAVPAPHHQTTEYNGARPEGLCLGLIFLKYVSDSFREKREQLLFGFSDPRSEWFIKDEPQRAEAAEGRDEHLNKDNCNSVPIPLPPLVEQTRIVAEVERRLSVVEELEAVVSANLQRATRLRQSVLQKAFTGKL